MARSGGGDARTAPRIAIVVVNYFGGDRTLQCLRDLDAMTWPRDRRTVVLVDNGSDEPFRSTLASSFPDVHLVVAPGNIGFGAACNLGFRRAPDAEYLALVNNDAAPAAGWLEPLVDELERHPEAGAATPKVLLRGRFAALTVRAPTVRAHPSDPRELGVQLCGARVGGADVSAGIHLVRGFWGWEHDAVTVHGDFAWSAALGEALVPVPEDAGPEAAVEVRLGGGIRDVEATVEVGGPPVAVRLGVAPAWFAAGDAGRAGAVINNAGTILEGDGSASDRGYLEVDTGQYDEAVEVDGWSAAAVLIARRFLDDVGDFDERFFLYYEDTDLSVRGRRRGWSYRYVPRSVVVHDHSGTVGERSPMARHLLARNRLLLLTKHAPVRAVAAEVAAVAADVARAVWRDVLRRLVAGRRPIGRHAAARARVLLAYARAAPSACWARRSLRRRTPRNR